MGSARSNGGAPLRRRLGKWASAVRGLLALLARPARRAQGRGGIVIEPYRGYGSPTRAFLIGRVFRQQHADEATGSDDLRASLRDIGRRIRRRAVRGVTVVARLGDAEARAVTDRDGYYRLHLEMRSDLPNSIDDWYAVAIEAGTDPPVRIEGRVFIPSRRSRIVVVSDIDDTVMKTGVANKLVMLWRLFVADADDRVAFPGVGAFYRALHAGQSGQEGNPILYVSRAPWGTYDMLTVFFRQHQIPVGPELFLREWGLSWRHPWPRRAEDHKRELIGHMLALYPDRSFVLIGDSGQHDPEVYADLVEANPGRIKAIYIRNLLRGDTREGEVGRLQQAVAVGGSELVLATDSLTMAEHAARLGLISLGSPAAVREDRTQRSVKGTTLARFKP